MPTHGVELPVIVVHKGLTKSFYTEYEFRDFSEDAEDIAANHLSLGTNDPTRLEDSRLVMGSDDLDDAVSSPLTVHRSSSQHTAD